MKALLAASLLVLLALAGCSGSGGDGTEPRQDGEGRYVIEMTAGNRFSPAIAKVPVGATVVWVHEGGAPHDVQGDGFSSGPAADMTEGDEYEHTFDEAGSYEYHCDVHEGSGMKGTIVVE
jgi:plastocyanin